MENGTGLQNLCLLPNDQPRAPWSSCPVKTGIKEQAWLNLALVQLNR